MPSEFKLRDYQEEDVARLVKVKRHIISLKVGFGKEQPVWSKVLTPSGWRQIGDLNVGDFVIGSTGKPIQVTGVFPQGLKPIYRVEVTDGGVTYAGAEHLWTVRDKQRYGSRLYTYTTQQMIDTGLNVGNGRRYILPMLPPVEFGVSTGLPALPVDPYLLGCLLGDGYISSEAPIGICNDDSELLDKVRSLLPEGGRLVHVNRIRWDIRYGTRFEPETNPIRQGLRALGLQPSNCYNKFIPEQYLYASVDVRIRLLQGLIDTDGYVNKSGMVEFYTVSQQMCKDVRFLVWSLGGKCFVRRRKNNSRNGYGDPEADRTIWALIINVPSSVQPCTLSRKLERYRGLSWPTRSIQSIEAAGEAECVCISVGAVDGLYVTDDFILTHNSAEALSTIARLLPPAPELVNGHKQRVLIVGPKVVHGVWRDEIKKWLDETCLIYRGTPEQRIDLRRQFIRGECGRFLIVSYAMLKELVDTENRRSAIWDAIILDEAHLYRNRKTAIWERVSCLKSPILLQLTATPVVSGLPDMWTLLYMVDPIKFRSYWKFVGEHCHVFKNQFGMEIEGVKNPPHTKEVLSRYMIRRTTGLKLPPLIRQRITFELEPEQRRLYDQMAEEMITEFRDFEDKQRFLLAPSVIAKLTRLRQIAISPELIGAKASSAAFNAFVEHASSVFDAGEKVVVFSPYVVGLKRAQEALRTNDLTRKVPTWMLTGGMSSTKFETTLKEFKQHKGTAVLFASITLGLGWDATEASVGYFIGFDWSAIVNTQDEGRLHRSGQEKTVRIYYLVGENTIDMDVLEVLDKKTRWSWMALDYFTKRDTQAEN